jgi:hypothetical protein
MNNQKEESSFLPLIVFGFFAYVIFSGMSDVTSKTPASDPAPAVQVQTEQQLARDEDGCAVATDSQLVSQHVVGPIQNLVKNKVDHGSYSECTVEFDIEVNGRIHHLTENEQGLEQLESLCYYARERARKNLLLDLGGEFKTQSTMNCRHRE